ncbi:TVP38/TMEM64 family protein [Sulfurospirillum diekertiae]|uniref:TVP38/TMEM64 family membrane protein n=1 Tax=Sulfurospirillum diekertiae TaxID=1854492 RepID=A0A6G9VVQ0_9BACT|nr:VTT domain-containing protein [Sulfurospirillum diekertiae]QIR76758.1 TVP38/TMEM64 family protein [Sulfurospirillum diekertiae]QIR79390.1 TVP38/TMEM64 family protein [Sulfurospirillum diekertiae]
MFVFYKNGVLSYAQVESIKTFVLGFGIYAPLIFIALFTLAPLIFFPDGILALAGGLIFGFAWGSFYIILGALCGGTLSFYLARLYSHKMREKLAHEKLIHFQKSVQKHGFVMILLLRLVPLVPFNIISYSAGFSTIRYRDFFFATLLGMMPGVLVYANIGAQSLSFGSQEFYLSVALLVVLVVVSMVLKHRVKKRLERYEK